MFWALALLLGGLAAFADLRSRTIPNWINVGALGAELVCQTFSHGLAGFGLGCMGAVIGFGAFLFFYCVGAMGGGDIKLMAAFGALLGPSGILVAALFAALIGGLLAGAAVLRSSRQHAIPYAPAIVLGAWLALLSKG